MRLPLGPSYSYRLVVVNAALLLTACDRLCWEPAAKTSLDRVMCHGGERSAPVAGLSGILRPEAFGDCSRQFRSPGSEPSPRPGEVRYRAAT